MQKPAGEGDSAAIPVVSSHTPAAAAGSAGRCRRQRRPHRLYQRRQRLKEYHKGADVHHAQRRMAHAGNEQRRGVGRGHIPAAAARRVVLPRGKGTRQAACRHRRQQVDAVQRQAGAAAAEYPRPDEGEDKGGPCVIAAAQQAQRALPGETAAAVQLAHRPRSHRIAAHGAQQEYGGPPGESQLPQHVEKAAVHREGYRREKGKQRRDHRPGAQRQTLPHRLPHRFILP